MKKIIVFTFAGLLLGATSSRAATLKVAADCTYPRSDIRTRTEKSKASTSMSRVP